MFSRGIRVALGLEYKVNSDGDEVYLTDNNGIPVFINNRYAKRHDGSFYYPTFHDKVLVLCETKIDGKDIIYIPMFIGNDISYVNLDEDHFYTNPQGEVYKYYTAKEKTVGNLYLDVMQDNEVAPPQFLNYKDWKKAGLNTEKFKFYENYVSSWAKHTVYVRYTDQYFVFIEDREVPVIFDEWDMLHMYRIINNERHFFEMIHEKMNFYYAFIDGRHKRYYKLDGTDVCGVAFENYLYQPFFDEKLQNNNGKNMSAILTKVTSNNDSDNNLSTSNDSSNLTSSNSLNNNTSSLVIKSTQDTAKLNSNLRHIQLYYNKTCIIKFYAQDIDLDNKIFCYGFDERNKQFNCQIELDQRVVFFDFSHLWLEKYPFEFTIEGYRQYYNTNAIDYNLYEEELNIHPNSNYFKDVSGKEIYSKYQGNEFCYLNRPYAKDSQGNFYYPKSSKGEIMVLYDSNHDKPKFIRESDVDGFRFQRILKILKSIYYLYTPAIDKCKHTPVGTIVKVCFILFIIFASLTIIVLHVLKN